MAPRTFISWICHFWARFWLNFNFGDFRAYFSHFSLVKIDFFKIHFHPSKKIFGKNKNHPQFLYHINQWKNTGPFDFGTFCYFQPYLPAIQGCLLRTLLALLKMLQLANHFSFRPLTHVNRLVKFPGNNLNIWKYWNIFPRQTCQPVTAQLHDYWQSWSPCRKMKIFRFS